MRRQNLNSYYEHVYNKMTSMDNELFKGYIAKPAVSMTQTRPPELISFEGMLDNGYATLYWNTENKFISSNYVIERSNDGVHFTTCGTLMSKKSDDISSYTFTDGNPIYTNAWYRLRSIERNGAFTYSHILILSVIISQDLSFYPYGEN